MIYCLIDFQLFLCSLFHCSWIRRKREINNEWVGFTMKMKSIIGFINKLIFDCFLMDVHKLISTFISTDTNRHSMKKMFILLHTIFSTIVIVVVVVIYCFWITSFRFESSILCDKILYAITPLEIETCNQQVRRNTFIWTKYWSLFV